MTDFPSILPITLIDAANNCAREGAVTTLTLKSGKEISGNLQKPLSGADTAHVKLLDGGWATALMAEIASVESRPDRRGW